MKILLTFVDLLLLPLSLLVYVGFFFFIGHKNQPHKRKHYKKLLILSPSGIHSVGNRGVDHLTFFDNGLFEKIFFICPRSPAARKLKISQRMSMIDVQEPAVCRMLHKSGLKYFVFILNQMYALSWLVSFIKRHEIDVIRSMEPHISGLNGVLLKRITGVKHVQDIRANFDSIYLGTGKSVSLPANFPNLFQRCARVFEKLLERVVYSNSDFIFGGSKNNLDYALYCGAPLDRSAVVRVNIQSDLFDDLTTRKNIRSDLNLSEKVFVFCGRLSPEKYPADALQAFIMLARTHSNVSLVFVGDGPEQSALENLTLTAKLDHRVHFLGYRDNQFIKNLFISVDGIVCPLAGSVLIEGALAELPIVAYDFEWHSELVIDHYSGLLADFGDYQGLCKAMAFILENPIEADQYGKRAKQIALNLFSHDNIRSKERAIYTKLFPS